MRATITGAEFDARHPDGRAWRQAGRPDYGFRVWQEAGAAARGLREGVDYEEGMWREYPYVRAWVYGALSLPAALSGDDGAAGEETR